MGARAFVLPACVVSCAVVSLLAWPTGAVARLVHPYLKSWEALENPPSSIATDSSTGDVYVQEGAITYRWDASGNPVEFSALHRNFIFTLGSSQTESQLAIDNSAGPAKGDLYAAHGEGSIGIFDDATGEKLGELTGEGIPWGEACGVAVDASGNVYVGLYPDHIDKFAPTGNPVTNADYVSSISGVNGVCNVGADSLGSAYSVTWSSGPITRYEASQFGSLTPTGSVVDGKGSTMAIDPATDEVYVDEQNQIAQFGPHGEPFEEPRTTFAASGPGRIKGSFGISVSGYNGDVYVSDGEGRISVFGPGIELELPAVTAEAPTELAGTKATLHGTVDPQGMSTYSEATWQFEYSTDGFSWKRTASGTVAPGTSPVAVSQQVSGLPPSGEVRFRLVATNAAGASQTATQNFTTPASPPEASLGVAAEPAVDEATLHGTVNPAGEPTSYAFEYGTTTAYGNSVPVGGASAGSGLQPVVVAQSATGLQPATTYHYRLKASNATGVTYSEDSTLTTYAQTMPQGNCPNEARRTEQKAAFLPDCRAYEMVSPLDKKGTDVAADGDSSLLSVTGERASYMALAGFGENHGSGGFGFTDYVAVRKEGEGWVSRGVTPTPKGEDFQLINGDTTLTQLSEAFERGIFEAYDLPQPTDDVEHGLNTYLEDFDSGALRTVTSVAQAPSPVSTINFFEPISVGSGDLGVISFQSEASLLPGLPAATQRYVWNHGVLEVASVLPDGSYPSGGAGAVGKGYREGGEVGHQVSRDGSRVLFESPLFGAHQIYMRRNATDTVWVSQPETSAPNTEPQGVEYLDMTRDGSKVLLASADKLTDSDPGGEGAGLYLYTDSPNPESEKNLTFIARVASWSLEIKASELYTGMSEDAKRIYFFSEPTSALPQKGTYLWDEGTLHFVASTERQIGKAAQLDYFAGTTGEATADGRKLAFLSRQQLTSAPLGGGKAAMYLYDEATESLRCVSCPSSGVPTSSEANIAPSANKLQTGGPRRPTFVTSDGRYVFFNTADALVPADVNKAFDAYEYDAQTGTVSLLSSGTGEGSWFDDASPDGANVLIVSRQSYLARDKDALVDVYDARVDGGFPEPPPSTGGCVGDECQGVPSAAPSFNTASGFSGIGNVAHPVSGKAKPKALTRKQKLARALKVCKRKKGKARRRCAARARKRYGAKKAGNTKSRAARR